MLFVDTSALLAILDTDARGHTAAAEAWGAALDSERALITSNYVVVETCALVQRRLGMDALREVTETILPLLRTVWVAEELHAAGMAALFTADRRRLSLVDCTSFEIMRRYGIRDVLALDSDFARQGFDLLPSPRQ